MGPAAVLGGGLHEPYTQGPTGPWTGSGGGRCLGGGGTYSDFGGRYVDAVLGGFSIVPYLDILSRTSCILGSLSEETSLLETTSENMTSFFLISPDGLCSTIDERVVDVRGVCSCCSMFGQTGVDVNGVCCSRSTAGQRGVDVKGGCCCCSCCSWRGVFALDGRMYVDIVFPTLPRVSALFLPANLGTDLVDRGGEGLRDSHSSSANHVVKQLVDKSKTYDILTFNVMKALVSSAQRWDGILVCLSVCLPVPQ